MCVVNIKFQPYDVYIGRAGQGRDGYFGNPFPIGGTTLAKASVIYATYFSGWATPEKKDATLHLLTKKDMTRQESILWYKKYLYQRASLDAEFRSRIIGLKGKVLGCFCKPSPCHGDVIKEFIEAQEQS